MTSVLIIRLSALGDVAMTIPVIYSVARRHSNIHFTLLTRRRFAHMLINAPSNLTALGIEPDDYRGPLGLRRLFNNLRTMDFDAVADLHDVLRSKCLRLQFSMCKGVRVEHIHKGRWQKQQRCRRIGRRHIALPDTFSRYMDVFQRLGLDTDRCFNSVFETITPNYADMPAHFKAKQAGQQWIGIAPFAKFEGKIYPTERMEQVVAQLSHIDGTRLFLFGHGSNEQQVLDNWAMRYPHVTSCVEGLTAMQEFMLMSQLDVMVSMDSANMHMASMVGTRVVSIWGATHPDVGFMGWKQDMADAIQDDIDCRPCSVFGSKPCHRGDMACMNNITPEQIVERVLHHPTHTPPHTPQAQNP